MNETVNLLKRAKNSHFSPQFSGVTKLICNIDDETQLAVGDDTGYTLEFDNPFMTQAILTAMLLKVRGYQYQPMTAEGALLDPAAELGDGVAVNGNFTQLFNRQRSFGRLMSANIESPADEEIDHEFQYVEPQQRKYKREMGNVKATLLIQADRIAAEVQERTEQGQTFQSQLSLHSTEIAAKVSATGGNNSSFGWTLDSASHTWYSGSQEVMKVSASGLEVKGKITATSGYIGNGSNGFTISATAIYNNISQFGGSQSTGVYIGTNGIQLGQGFKVNSSGAVTATSLTITGGSININNKFIVDSQGNLTANSGTFAGSVNAGNIRYGGSYGTFSGSGITGSSIGTGKFVSGVNTSLGYANFSNDVFNSESTVKYMKAQMITGTTSVSAKSLGVWGGSSYLTALWKSIEVVTDVTVGSTSRLGTARVGGVDGYCQVTVPTISVDSETIYYLGRS